MKIKAVILVFLFISSAAAGIQAATDEGYGEDSAALGQFVDSFETSENVSVAVDVIQNSTLEVMELNQTTGLRWEFSNLDYFEGFENFPVGWTPITANGGTITKSNEQVYNGSWSVKVNTPNPNMQAFAYDAMPEQAGNFHLRYFIYPDGGDQPDNCYVVLLHDVSSTTNFISILDWQGGVWYLQNQDSDSVDNVGALTTDTWNRIDVSWDDTANKFNYSINDVNQGLFDAFSDSNPDRIYVGDTSAGAQEAIYWVDDVALGTAAQQPAFSVFKTAGYFTTVDYLQDPLTNGSILAQMTIATIPANTLMTVQFSVDNSTWVNNEGSAGYNTITDGFLSIDLRKLNWSTFYYQRYNLSSSDFTITPRLNQSRLITTIGNASSITEIQNVSGAWVKYNLTEFNASVGTVDAGLLSSTFFIDGIMFNVSEVEGVPGMMLSGNFTDVDEDAISLWLLIYAQYDGNLNHDFDIEFWDFESSAWIEDEHITDVIELTWFNSTIYRLRIPARFLRNGEVRIRLDHESAGNINHDLMIDQIQLQAFIPSAAADEPFQFFWIVIGIALMIIGIVLARMWPEEGDP